MDKTTLTGCILILLGLGFISYVTFRSRAIIERIGRKKNHSTREMLKELQDDQ